MGMYVSNYLKYVNGQDITRVAYNELTYPSQNCLLYKGKCYTRPGITNDGNAPTGTDGIIGEKVWKDQVGGQEVDSRATGQKWQTLVYGKWVTIFSGFVAGASHVRWDTWLDTNGSIYKKRMYGVDGSENIYEWNGSIAAIDSFSGSTAVIEGSQTLEQLGFDDASGAPLAVMIVRFDADDNVLGTEVLNYNIAVAGAGSMVFTTPPVTAPSHGDLIIAVPITHTGVLTGILKDDIYTYKNQIAIGSLSGQTVKISNGLNALDFVVPLTTPTTLSPYDVILPGYFTAMIARLDVLWLSTPDGWINLTHSLTANPDGGFNTVKSFDQPERNGALPFAVTSYSQDAIFMSQDHRLQQITTIALTGKDALLLLSDDVDFLLLNTDMTGIRLYFQLRYIFIVCPAESKLLMLDTVGYPEYGIPMFWQPPQIVPMSCFSVIDGAYCGHSNAQDETYFLFSGGSDLGADITTIMAFGYIGGEFRKRYINIQDRHQLYMHTRIGVDGRITPTTIVTATQLFETDGVKNTQDSVIDGSKIKTFKLPIDYAWTSLPWTSAAWLGEAVEDTENTGDTNLERFYVFDKNESTSWFEHRMVFTLVGQNMNFHLLGFSMDIQKSDRKIDSALWLTK